MRRDNENRRDFTARPSRERDDRDPCLRRSIQKNRAIHIDAIYYCFAPIMNLSDYYKFLDLRCGHAASPSGWY